MQFTKRFWGIYMSHLTQNVVAFVGQCQSPFL